MRARELGQTIGQALSFLQRLFFYRFVLGLFGLIFFGGFFVILLMNLKDNGWSLGLLFAFAASTVFIFMGFTIFIDGCKEIRARATRRVPAAVWKGIAKLMLGFAWAAICIAAWAATKNLAGPLVLFCYVCIVLGIAYISWGISDLATASFRINSIVTKADELRIYFLPPIQRYGAVIVAVLLIFALSLGIFAFPWRDWSQQHFPTPPMVAIYLLVLAAMIAALWSCFLLVGRAYGAGVWSGFWLSVWVVMMFAGIAFVPLTAFVLFKIFRQTLEGDHSPIPLEQPVIAVGLAVMWWFGRRRFLRSVRWLTGDY